MLLLGSQSPRRAEILQSLRVPYVVRTADVDETVLPGERPGAYLERVVAAKLRAVHASAGDLAMSCRAILVADTSVILPGSASSRGGSVASLGHPADGDAILGKPASVDEAAAMTERLAGRAHQVMTRFAIGAMDDGRPLHAETVTTRVVFRPLTREQARAYAESREGLDKAGAYAVQGLGGALVSQIEGSYSNVVGLPACELAVALERLGLWSLGG
jgi:septum formation protein